MNAGLENAFARNRADLYRFAYRMLHTPESAEECTQEAFLRLAQSADFAESSSGHETVRRWLFVVVRNLCISRLRRETRGHAALSSIADAAYDGPEMPSEVGQSTERREWVARAVRALPPGQREVVVLREYQGMSYAEIAAIIGCTEGTVKSRLARGRETLRRRLAPLWEVYR